MNNWQSYIFTDGNGKRADITKIPRPGRVVFKLTITGDAMVTLFSKSFPTYKQARERLAAESESFRRIA